MTIEQIKCAIEVASCGSINKAARNLYLSQPRLSQSMRSMEEELGYQVFERLPQGIIPTAKGDLFLNYCETIISEYRKALILVDEKTLRSFHLAAGSLYLFIEAFVRLCKDYQEDEVLDLQIKHKNSHEIEEEVYQGASQLGILLVKENELTSYIQSVARKNLTAQSLCHIGLVVTVRKGHPVLEKSHCDLTDLYQYPFVDYGGREVSNLFAQEIESLVNPEKIIRIEERETRHKIVSSTNAFGIGCKLAERILEQYGLVAIPLRDSGFQIVYLYRSQSSLSEESKCYLNHVLEVIIENNLTLS